MPRSVDPVEEASKCPIRDQLLDHGAVGVSLGGVSSGQQWISFAPRDLLIHL